MQDGIGLKQKLVDAGFSNIEQIRFIRLKEKYSKRVVKGEMFQAQQEIEAAQKAGGITSGVPSGFRDLDSVTTGFHKGTLIILAARPAMGKTALALSMARNMAVDHNIPIAFFSLEMTALELELEPLIER